MTQYMFVRLNRVDYISAYSGLAAPHNANAVNEVRPSDGHLSTWL